MKRLQGKEFYKIKKYLTPIKYIINKNGHVEGIYINKNGCVINHWLSNDEIELLKEEDETLIYKVAKTKMITYRELLNLIHEEKIPNKIWLCLIGQEIEYAWIDRNAYILSDDSDEDENFKYYLMDSLIDEQAANDEIIKIIEE